MKYSIKKHFASICDKDSCVAIDFYKDLLCAALSNPALIQKAVGSNNGIDKPTTVYNVLSTVDAVMEEVLKGE
jgi:2-hydroxy-3-keto-5-methylthiopentenyl-1-phosphate phosphatase